MQDFRHSIFQWSHILVKKQRYDLYFTKLAHTVPYQRQAEEDFCDQAAYVGKGGVEADDEMVQLFTILRPWKLMILYALVLLDFVDQLSILAAAVGIISVVLIRQLLIIFHLDVFNLALLLRKPL